MSPCDLFLLATLPNTLTWDVDPNQTIEELKLRLEAEYQFPVDEQQLYFNGKELEGPSRLSDYDLQVQDDNALSLVLDREDTCQIFIKTLSGKSEYRLTHETYGL